MYHFPCVLLLAAACLAAAAHAIPSYEQFLAVTQRRWSAHGVPTQPRHGATPAAAGAAGAAAPFAAAYCGPAPAQPWWSIPPATGAPAPLSSVAVVIRHGDRASSGWIPAPKNGVAKMICFPGDIQVWDCNNMTQNQEPGFLTAAGVEDDDVHTFVREYEKGQNVQAGTCGASQLTPRGFAQQVRNGQALRAAYSSLLSNNATRFYARSTDVDRTRASLAGLWRGLRGAPGGGGCAPDADVPLFTKDQSTEDMYTSKRRCPHLAAIRNAAYNSAAWSAFEKRTLNGLLTKAGNVLGVGLPLSLPQMRAFMDCAWSQACHNLTVIPGAIQAILPAVEAARLYELVYTYGYPNVTYQAKFGIGSFLEELFSRVDNVDASQPTFSVFSGHDTTVYPLEQALDVLNQTHYGWVPYAAAVVVENYSNKVLRFLYNGEVLYLPACGGVELCPYSTFMNYVKTMYPPSTLAYDCLKNYFTAEGKAFSTKFEDLMQNHHTEL